MGNFTLSVGGILAIVVQFGLPLVVGFVTKQSWSSGMKTWLLLFLSAVTQFLTTWAEAAAAGTHFSWTTALWSALVGFVLAVAAHYGIWKPTGATDAAQRALVRDNYTLAG